MSNSGVDGLLPPVCVISSNKIAANYLRGFLSSRLSTETYVAEEYLQRRRSGVRSLFVIDCTQLNVPLSKYLSRLIEKFPIAVIIVIDFVRSQEDILFVISLGVQGYVPHDQIDSLLVPAAETVMAGGYWIPQSTRSAPTARLQGQTRARADSPTYREMQVLELLKRRFSNKEIADALKIKECTAKYHVSNLLEKLQVTKRVELSRSGGATHSIAAML